MFKLTPALKIILLVNIAVFILDTLLGTISVGGIDAHFWGMKYFALEPLSGLNVRNIITFDFMPWQLITYQFMHGGFWHLFFNMFMLWMFGNMLEEIWGSAKFLVFYLLSGIGAGILHLLISQLMGHYAPTIGASGSLYGIMIGFCMLNPDAKMFIFPIFIPIKARWVAIGMMAFALFNGVTGSEEGVAHFAHLGGALMGLLLIKWGEKTSIFKLSRKYIKFGIPSNEFVNSSNVWGNINDRESKRKSFFGNSDTSRGYSVNWAEPETKPQNQQPTSQTTTKHHNLNDILVGGQKITQATIDTILDKISKSGYASLTEQEKYILTEISKQI